MKMTSSVTETVAGAPASGNYTIIVEDPDFTLTFGAGIRWTQATFNGTFKVFLNGATIAWANATASESPFNFTGGDPIVEFHGGGTFTNTSTNEYTTLCLSSIGQHYFGHYVVNLPNEQNAGIYATSGSHSFYLESAEFIGGGTSCYNALIVGGTGRISIGILEFSGGSSSWNTGVNKWPFWVYPTTNTAHIDVIDMTAADAMYIRIDCSVNSLKTDVASVVDINPGARVHGGKFAATTTIRLPLVPPQKENIVFDNFDLYITASNLLSNKPIRFSAVSPFFIIAFL